MSQLCLYIVPLFVSEANVNGLVFSKLANVAVKVFKDFDNKSQKL